MLHFSLSGTSTQRLIKYIYCFAFYICVNTQKPQNAIEVEENFYLSIIDPFHLFKSFIILEIWKNCNSGLQKLGSLMNHSSSETRNSFVPQSLMLFYVLTGSMCLIPSRGSWFLWYSSEWACQFYSTEGQKRYYVEAIITL